MTVKQLNASELKALRSIISKYNPQLANTPKLGDKLLNTAWNNIPDVKLNITWNNISDIKRYELYASLEKILKTYLAKQKTPSILVTNEGTQKIEKSITSPQQSNTDKPDSSLITGPDLISAQSDSEGSEPGTTLKGVKSYKYQGVEAELPVSESKVKVHKDDNFELPSFPPSGKNSKTITEIPENKVFEALVPPQDKQVKSILPLTKSPNIACNGTSRRVSETDPVTSQITSPLVEDKQTEIHNQATKAEDCDHYSLKNGMVSQKYSDTINLEKIFRGGKIRDYTIEGLAEIGLELDAKSGQVTGIPQKQGDSAQHFDFELVIRYETENGEKESRKLFIKILPDPKSLWKTLEPPEELEDRKLHEYKKRIVIKKDGVSKERKIIAASKRGRSHAHKASFRDDHVSVKYLDEFGWSILAVADGAGSANLSRVASQIACETAITNISNKLMANNDDLSIIIKDTISKNDNEGNEIDDNKLRKLLYEIVSTTAFEAAKAIHEKAAKRQVKGNQFYTTYLTAIHKEFDFGNFFAGFWVGDGALGVYTKAKEIELLGIPDEGEYSGQTRFITMSEVLTSEELMGRICYKLTDDFTALFAMSDGVSDPKFETDKNLKDISYWDNLWAELEKDVFQTKDSADTRLLKWLDFWAEGEHDDRTIAILY